MHFSIKFVYKKERKKNETVMGGVAGQGNFYVVTGNFSPAMIGSEESNELGMTGGNNKQSFRDVEEEGS